MDATLIIEGKHLQDSGLYRVHGQLCFCRGCQRGWGSSPLRSPPTPRVPCALLSSSALNPSSGCCHPFPPSPRQRGVPARPVPSERQRTSSESGPCHLAVGTSLSKASTRPRWAGGRLASASRPVRLGRPQPLLSVLALPDALKTCRTERKQIRSGTRFFYLFIYMLNRFVAYSMSGTRITGECDFIPHLGPASHPREQPQGSLGPLRFLCLAGRDRQGPGHGCNVCPA